MTYDGQDRRGKSSERRKTGSGAPPPGTVIDRRMGLDQRDNNDPRAKTPEKTSGESPKGNVVGKPRKKSLVPTSEAPAGTDSGSGSGSGSGSSPTGDGFTGLERKRGRGRRLSEFTKSAEEGEMTTEQFLFLMAIDAFKKGNDRMFPTWTDVLEVIRLLGYRKTMPTELNLPSAEDWLERSDTPANVRPDRWAERFTDSQLDTPAISTGPQSGSKSESELTDEALDAFEAAFGSEDEAEEFMGDDFDADTDFDDGFSEAA